MHHQFVVSTSYILGASTVCLTVAVLRIMPPRPHLRIIPVIVQKLQVSWTQLDRDFLRTEWEKMGHSGRWSTLISVGVFVTRLDSCTGEEWTFRGLRVSVVGVELRTPFCCRRGPTLQPVSSSEPLPVPLPGGPPSTGPSVHPQDYLHFMAAKAVENEDTSISPPLDVDQLWQVHLLNTKHWRVFEKLVLSTARSTRDNLDHSTQTIGEGARGRRLANFRDLLSANGVAVRDFPAEVAKIDAGAAGSSSLAGSGNNGAASGAAADSARDRSPRRQIDSRDEVQIFVRTFGFYNERTATLDVNLNGTVATAKARLGEKTGVPPQHFWLSFQGKTIENCLSFQGKAIKKIDGGQGSLTSHGICSGSTLWAVLRQTEGS